MTMEEGHLPYSKFCSKSSKKIHAFCNLFIVDSNLVSLALSKESKGKSLIIKISIKANQKLKRNLCSEEGELTVKFDALRRVKEIAKSKENPKLRFISIIVGRAQIHGVHVQPVPIFHHRFEV